MSMASEGAVVVHGKNESGAPVFSLLVKRTYRIRPGQASVRAEKDRAFTRSDEYYDHADPETATVRYENDLCPFKPATDVVVIGKAYAPGGKPTSLMDAAVEVAGRQKVIRVIGDRQCAYQAGRPPRFGDPVPFTEMEIRYERAYGGQDLRSIKDLPFHYPRNNMGKGVALKNVAEVVDKLPLPNLEDPQDLLTPERVVFGEPDRWNRQPIPQGFGWFQKTWYPRCSFVGAFPGFVGPDEVMREETLGLVPKNQIALARQFKLPSFDVRFNNGASPGLVFPFLTGKEPIRISGMTKEGELRFQLPGETPRLGLDIGLGERELTAVLHTVCIRLEEMEVDMTWGGAHEYPGLEWLPEMKKMEPKVS